MLHCCYENTPADTSALLDNKQNWLAIKIITQILWFHDQNKAQNKSKKKKTKNKETSLLQKLQTVHISDMDYAKWLVGIECVREIAMGSL